MLSGCTSKEDAERALYGAGYSDANISGYNIMGCTYGEFVRTRFVAKNPVGNVVEGTVCSGFVFKNATIRF